MKPNINPLKLISGGRTTHTSLTAIIGSPASLTGSLKLLAWLEKISPSQGFDLKDHALRDHYESQR